MFEELFTNPSTVERYRTAPLAEYRLGYLQHLKGTGAKRSTLRSSAVTQLSLIRLLDLQEDDKVTVSQVKAEARKWSLPGGRRYHRHASPNRRSFFLGHALRWLRFLGWLDETDNVQHAYSVEVAVYEAWMRDERGLSEDTIANCGAAANQFFNWLTASNIPLASVRITDIDAAIAAKSADGNCRRRTIHDYAQRLRALFGFAEDRGWCLPGMAAAIMPPRFYSDETVPKGITRPVVERLLATTETDCAVDKRDRAILMLLVAYGLRAGEVAMLRLDDLDWENEILRVRRPKPGRTHFYPLSQGVGQAIVRYIVDVRPPTPERALFFTLVAPIRPVTRSTLGTIVSRRLQRIGIVAGRRGPHALRHAAAQHLLDEGMSMKVIGDFLGHRDPSSTAIYAKVNLDALREVANFNLEGLA